MTSMATAMVENPKTHSSKGSGVDTRGKRNFREKIKVKKTLEDSAPGGGGDAASSPKGIPHEECLCYYPTNYQSEETKAPHSSFKFINYIFVFLNELLNIFIINLRINTFHILSIMTRYG